MVKERKDMVLHIQYSGNQGEECHVLCFFVMTGLLLAKGYADLGTDSLIYPLPVPPGVTYTTSDIFLTPHNCCTVTLTYDSTDNCTFIREISGCEPVVLAVTGLHVCAINQGSFLTSSVSVDIYFNIKGAILKVLPIDQLGKTYLFRPFNQTTNEICEQLFIYTTNNSATLDICSDDFPQTNMASLVDREVINETTSRMCFRRALYEGDGLVVNGLSSASRLQINSDRPIGILYGLSLSSVDNKSCLSEENEERLNWQFLPPVAKMGKLFVIVSSSDAHITILGVTNAAVRIQLSRNETLYNVTARDSLSLRYSQEGLINIESNTSVFIQVTQRDQNCTTIYFATPMHLFRNSSSEATKQSSDDGHEITHTISSDRSRSFPIVCTESNVNIYFGTVKLRPMGTDSHTAFGKYLYYVLYFKLPENATFVTYPKSLCSILYQSIWTFSDSFQSERGDSDFHKYMSNASANSDIPEETVVRDVALKHTYSVINLKSVLDKNNYSLKQENLLNEENTFTSSQTKLSIVPVTNAIESTVTNRERSQVIQNGRDEVELRDNKLPNNTDVHADSVINITDEESRVTEHNYSTPKKANSNTTKLNVTSKLVKYPVRMQNPSEQEADPNKQFKMVVDIIQTKHGELSNSLMNDQQNNNNPPYAIDADMFLTNESELDRKSSMAVIISLSAALSAVLLVIFIFFLIEIFTGQKHIRNTRIRPSVSFY